MLQETQVREALEGVRSLVQADGGDIQLVSLDTATSAVHLQLVVEGASCQECILPRPMLEDIAAGIIRRTVPELATLSIDDPREHPDYVPDAH
jgi:Fe-S cluster biogenesis protein NfuA